MMKIWTALVAMLFAVGLARADDVSDFYKGKQITVVLGYGPGGGYDIYARLVAQHLGKYVAGNPSVVVQNMPGAGSLRAANYIYTSAPKNGLFIGSFGRDIPLMAVLGHNSAVQFDPAKYTWLGSPSTYADDAYLLWSRDDAPVKSIAEAQKKGGPPLVVGATGEGSTDNDVTVLLTDVFGLNVKLVAGYPDSPSISVAMERKELDAHFLGLSATNGERPQWLNPGSGFHVILQFARKTRLPQFPVAPTARELATNERTLALIDLAEMPYTLSRPFVAPPGLPEDRAKALQKAFMDLQKDPQYLADAAKLKIDISPIGGADAATLIERISKAPPEILEHMRKLLAEHKG